MAYRIQWLFGALVVASVVGACDLSEQLEGEPCKVAKDCWHTQECVRTADEAILDLPGLCQPKGTECIAGRQLGCACVPSDPSLSCTLPAVPPELYATYPKMVCDPKLLLCTDAPAESEEQP